MGRERVPGPLGRKKSSSWPECRGSVGVGRVQGQGEVCGPGLWPLSRANREQGAKSLSQEGLVFLSLPSSTGIPPTPNTFCTSG